MGGLTPSNSKTISLLKVREILISSDAAADDDDDGGDDDDDDDVDGGGGGDDHDVLDIDNADDGG